MQLTYDFCNYLEKIPEWYLKKICFEKKKEYVCIFNEKICRVNLKKSWLPSAKCQEKVQFNYNYIYSLCS